VKKNLTPLDPTNFYTVPTNNDWAFYNQERYLLIDEFYGQIPIGELNRISKGGAQVNFKGGSKLLRKDCIVIILSRQSPEDCYRSFRSASELESLYQRFHVFRKYASTNEDDEQLNTNVFWRADNNETYKIQYTYKEVRMLYDICDELDLKEAQNLLFNNDNPLEPHQQSLFTISNINSNNVNPIQNPKATITSPQLTKKKQQQSRRSPPTTDEEARKSSEKRKYVQSEHSQPQIEQTVTLSQENIITTSSQGEVPTITTVEKNIFTISTMFSPTKQQMSQKKTKKEKNNASKERGSFTKVPKMHQKDRDMFDTDADVEIDEDGLRDLTTLLKSRRKDDDFL
jgi:hypothetical protein